MTAARITREAAEWVTLLDSGEATAEQQAAWQAWYRALPQHRLVFDRMRELDGRFLGLDAAQKQRLRRFADSARRQRRARALSVMALALAAGALLWRFQPEGPVREDFRTARGELRTVTLIDASTLRLDTDTDVRTEFDARRRTVSLRRGRVSSAVARDPHRPFVVATVDATATALGTIYSVSVDEGGTTVTVTESRVQVCTRSRDACAELLAGQRVRVAHGRLSPVERAPDAATAWTAGWLEVQDAPVAEVLAELNRYLATPVRSDVRALDSLRVTGTYPLTEPGSALEALAATTGLSFTPDAEAEVRER